MAGIKISALPAAASAQLTDVFPADQDPGPVTRKITLQQVQDLFSASGVISLEGTQNEVLVNGTYGTPITGTAIKLSTPQQIATTSSPTFAAMTVNGAISNLTFINDVNGNHVLGFTSPSSAVNYFGFQNSITGVSPSISVLGSDTNVGLTIASKGTGTLNFDTLATTNQINFITGTTYQHATVFNFANTAFSRTVTWPDATGTVAFTSDLTGFVTSVSGTTNRITSTGGTTPVIDISASYVGQSSITTLGTIATGVWQGTLVGPTYGGTGVNNGSNTLTLAGNLATAGAFSSTFTMTAATAVTFPTSGTLATTSQLVTPAALTKTDDTNVTLTLGGSPTTALVNAASITAGWTGQLGLTRGGTAASLTASNGGIVYSSASALAILGGTATANQLLMSGASTTPAWSTTTYPATNAINTIMYASSANVLGVISPVNSAVMISSSGGVPSMSTTLPSGIAATNMNLTTPTLGVASATSLSFSSTSGIIGTTTNDNAAAGSVGEYVSSNVLLSSATNIPSNTATNLTSISLTKGDWDVFGNITYQGSSAISIIAWANIINTASATIPADGSNYVLNTGTSTTFAGGTCITTRISIASTTTVYLIGYVTLSGVTTCVMGGNISARRVR